MNDLKLLQAPSLGDGSSLVADIQKTLRGAIVEGTLGSGFRLRESQLAEHFGCSATPVREAIRKLETEGLVTVYPRRGAEVTSYTLADVEHLYEMRLVIEPYAARRAAELRPSATGMEPLRELIDRQNIASGNAPTTPIDADVHFTFALLAGNPIMAELIGQTTRQIEVVQSRLQAVVARGLEAAHDAHTGIFAAIARGDGPNAERLMREHIEFAGEAVLSSMRTASAAGARHA